MINISKTELISLREKRNFTIPQIAEYYKITKEQAKRAMLESGLSTSTKGIKKNKFIIID
ncbi:MAG: hypothetical protein K1X33_06440 [Methanobacteriaceae archaeon]|nr:hypothetical protein [Methanobacteriaceae archaeon]RTK96922.1 MAG: hypothetical protein EKK64_02675 [Neisseriaceae bacterium]